MCNIVKLIIVVELLLNYFSVLILNTTLKNFNYELLLSRYKGYTLRLKLLCKNIIPT